MPTQTELCEFRTADGEILHGAMFSPADRTARPDMGIVLVHGVALSFYMRPLPAIAAGLAEQGYAALCVNTRGHDWVARGGNGTAFAGAAFERLEDCLADIDAAIAWLQGRGVARVALFGHSLGGLKVFYYQGTRQRADVAGVVSCSTPKHFYRVRLEEEPEFAKHFARAQALVDTGQGGELLWAPAGSGAGLFSAATFVNKYGPDERSDVRPYAARLGVPLLVTAGSEEPAFVAHAHELAAAAGAEQGTVRVFQGGDHYYRGQEPALAETVAVWLQRVVG